MSASDGVILLLLVVMAGACFVGLLALVVERFGEWLDGGDGDRGTRK